jgi:hypothetical protein
MSLEQTVEIPPSRRLFVDVPHCPEELKTKLQNLQGSLGKTAYGGMDGIAYQRKVREEWAN